MSPWLVSRPLFLAAIAWPRSLKTRLAPSISPSDSSRALFTSIIPAAVSSRSCLIFSIKASTSPRSLRSAQSLHSPHPTTLPRLPRPRRYPVRQPPAPRRLPVPQRPRAPRPPESRGLARRPRRPAPLRDGQPRRRGPCLRLLGASVQRVGRCLFYIPFGHLPRLLEHGRQRPVFGRERLLSPALDDRVGDEPRYEGYCPDGVVVAGDHVVYDLRVAVGVGEGDDRYLQAVGLLDQQLFALGVYYEDRAGETLHLRYAREVPPELLVLAVQGEPLLAGALLLRGLLDPPGQVFEVLDAWQYRLEIGQDTADVTLGDRGLSAPYGLLGQRDLGLFLGADEENLAPGLGHSPDERQRAVEQRERLIQVDYVDPGALGEDVTLHLGVPALGLMPEVNPGFEQLSDPYTFGRTLQDATSLFRWLISSARASQSASC